MSATIVPAAWLAPETKVPLSWLNDAQALERERGNRLFFVSTRTYSREIHALSDIDQHGFGPLGAEVRLVGTGRDFRIVIPSGRKPHVLARHLTRVAPTFAFDLVREVLGDASND